MEEEGESVESSQSPIPEVMEIGQEDSRGGGTAASCVVPPHIYMSLFAR